MHLFVTGTDTGVGKTFVSSLLCFSLKRKYWKPIQSGTDSITDSEWVSQKIGSSQVLPEVYRLSQPLSPHLSAQLDQVEIYLNKIVDVYKNLSSPHIIEGAGGLLVPLNNKQLIIDLIKSLEVPIILVARSSLGTINHTLLSLEAARYRGISILGVIMVGTPYLENRNAIERYGKTKVLAEVPLINLTEKSVFSKVAEEVKEGVKKWTSI